MNKLGKGLSTLVPDNVDCIHETTTYLKIKDLYPGKFQHRKFFDDEKLYELSLSIKTNGVIQPIIVRKNFDLDGYEIIAGERRTRAAEIAGLSEIPALIVEIDDKKALEMSIIENIQRDDLNVIEEAQGYKNLISEFGFLQDELSEVVGKSRSHITNCLRILSLPDEIKLFLKKGFLSMGHARALVGVKNPVEMANKIIRKALSVRQTESLVKNFSEKGPRQEKDRDIILLEEQISSKLGMEVKINDNKKVGAVVISFRNLNELNFILKKLSSNLES